MFYQKAVKKDKIVLDKIQGLHVRTQYINVDCRHTLNW